MKTNKKPRYQVVQLGVRSFKQPLYGRYGEPLGERTVTQKPGYVCAEHQCKDTAEKHAAKNRKMFGIPYGVVDMDSEKGGAR